MRATGIARLYSIAVAPEARGAGVGAACWRRPRRRAPPRRAAIRLEVRTDNSAARGSTSDAATAFRHEDDYYEDGRDALRYEKALRAGTRRHRGARVERTRRFSPSRP